MLTKFFTLKVVDPDTGRIYKATWAQRFRWLFTGCHTRDARVVERFCNIKAQKKMTANVMATVSSDKF